MIAKLNKNVFLIIGILILIITAEFIFGQKQLQYGFFIDDWDNLAAYKIVVKNPITDLPYAWTSLGSHRFAHVYYMGILYDVFKLNYEYYNILNQFLKAISAFTLFPLIYLLFRSKLLAFLTAIIYVTHFSPFGALDDVSRGEDYLAIICMSLFLITYTWASKRQKFDLKILFSLLLLLLATILLAPSRTYPLMLLLPLVELLNHMFHKGTTIKSSISRLLFLYSPFIILFIFSPQSILAQVGYYKALWEMLKLGNYQLFLIPLASFGSTYISVDFLPLLFKPPRYDTPQLFMLLLSGMAVFFGFIYFGIGILISHTPKRFLINSLLISVCFSFFVFMVSKNWLVIDQKFRASVDPGVFIIPSLVGLFVLVGTISIFLEWLKTKKKNNLLLSLVITPWLSFLYIFFTWVLSDVNSVFMGIHAYLNIPAIGTSIFLSILLYLVYLKLNRTLLAKWIIVSLLGLLLLSYTYSVDKYFSYWLKNGMASIDQQRMIDTFWKEVALKQYNYKNPILIYLDSFEDYANGMYYENAFIWKIPAYFMVKTGDTLAACDILMYKVELSKLKLEKIDGRTVISVDRCGPKIIYPIENFYSFKLKDRNLIPNKIDILQKLEVNLYE